jgi:hypothetical protein
MNFDVYYDIDYETLHGEDASLQLISVVVSLASQSKELLVHLMV